MNRKKQDDDIFDDTQTRASEADDDVDRKALAINGLVPYGSDRQTLKRDEQEENEAVYEHESDHDAHAPLEPGHELWKESRIQSQNGHLGEDLHQNVEHLAEIIQLQKLYTVCYWNLPIVEPEPHERHSEDDDGHGDEEDCSDDGIRVVGPETPGLEPPGIQAQAEKRNRQRDCGDSDGLQLVYSGLLWVAFAKSAGEYCDFWEVVSVSITR